MPFVTIGGGGSSSIEDGVYTIVVTEISDPKTVIVRATGDEIDLIDWTFAIVDGEYADSTITESTSTASGPKSKMYGWLSALLGARPDAGQTFEKSDVIGRMGLATIARKEDGGWPKIVNLSALPKSMRVAPAPAAAPQSVRSSAAPLKGLPVAAQADSLPF